MLRAYLPVNRRTDTLDSTVDSNNQPVRLSGPCPSACLLLACLALVVAPVPVQGGDGPPPIVKGTFPSGGQPIRVEQFEPDGKGKCPAVVFLYGVDGLHAGNETAFRI